MKTVTSRYDMRKERDGTWTAFDISAGLPVELNGVQIMYLSMEEADDAIDLLNHLGDRWRISAKQ